MNAIGLPQLRLPGQSEGDLFSCQEEVLTADEGRLCPEGSFRTTLTLGTTAVDPTTCVFHHIDDALLSWYGARAVRLIPTLPQQLSLRCGPTASTSAEKSLIEGFLI